MPSRERLPERAKRVKPAEKSDLVVPAALKRVVQAIGAEKISVEKGWGSANVTLKTRGKIFAMQIGADIVLKLPKARVDRLVAERRGERFDPRKNGRVMKEWIVLSAGARTALAGEAYAFVSGETLGKPPKKRLR
jgi:hypothetical protein